MVEVIKSLPLSSYALIGANLIPLFGVLFFEWNPHVVLVLYWIENLIIGGLNIIKMLSVSALNKHTVGVFSVLFFILHYGAFCSAHGMLLANILGYEQSVDTLMETSSWPLFSELFQHGWVVLQVFVEKLSPAILFGAAMLGLSHLVSFIENFILRGEIFKKDVQKLMVAPYSQIVVMHVGLLVGALIMTKLHSPIWLMCVIVIAKIIVDYHMHQKRHQKAQSEHLIKDF